MTLSPELRRSHARAVKMPLGSWLLAHPLPAIVEPKYDGRRGFVYYSRGKMLFTTKTYKSVYTRLSHPALFADIPSRFLAQTLILDTEAYPRKNPDHIAVFDILEKDGRDMTHLSQQSRKESLLSLFYQTEHFHSTPYDYGLSAGEIQRFKEQRIAEGFEGVMVKDTNLRYGETGAWLKLKKKDTLDAVVMGPDPENDTYKQTGVAHSWFVGLYNDGGELEPWGKVGTYEKQVNPALIQRFTVVEIAYQEATKEKKLRDPRIIAIRDDKTPIECTTEQVEGETD